MTPHPRFALLRIVVLVALALRCGTGDAVGLGPLRLQSALGQPLRATVQVLGSDAAKLAESCIRVTLKMPDGSELVRPQFELRQGKTAATELAITTARTVDEPAVELLVEITCTPTLHRDYQLLLDLRDGLPRVVSTLGEEPQQENPPRAAVSTAGEGSARSRRRSTRSAASARAGSDGLRAVAASELQTMAAGDAPKPRPARAKPAPTSRSVLKLTQTDTLQGDSVKASTRHAAGLKFSQSLGMGAEPGRPDSEELDAAKARFQAVLRNEDALVAARRELKALLSKTAAGVAPPAVPAVAQATQTPPANPAENLPATLAAQTLAEPAAMPSPANVSMPASAVGQPTAGGLRSPFASTSLMLGMALLMAAGLAMLWRYARGSRKGGRAARKNMPWWQATGDDAAREAQLLESARANLARKEPAIAEARVTAGVAEAETERALKRYVNNFIGKRDGNGAAVDVRIEPSGLAGTATEKTAGKDKAPVAQSTATTDRQQQANSKAGPPDDAPGEVARNKLATFELVSDVMQEAEFWKMLNETQRAIDILENYCSSASSASPAPWLYLADLYHGIGDDERHAQLCNRFREIFNGRLHEADANTPAGRDTLEGYPHLMEKISEMWGQERVVPFLQGLLVNDRDSPREGFYLPVYQEILLLIDVAMEREQAAA